MSARPCPTIHNQEPAFLNVRPGHLVIVQNDAMPGEPLHNNWWMGQILHCTGGARNPNNHNLFQIIDVDDGTIRWVNADLVSHILHSLDGLCPSQPTIEHHADGKPYA